MTWRPRPDAPVWVRVLWTIIVLAVLPPLMMWNTVERNQSYGLSDDGREDFALGTVVGLAFLAMGILITVRLWRNPREPE
jgi:hypothetical protein